VRRTSGPILALVGGGLLIATAIAAALRSGRDGPTPIFAGLIGSLILIQVTIAVLLRGWEAGTPGSRTARVARALAVAGPLAIAAGILLVMGGAPWEVGSLLALIGLVASFASWMAAAVAMLQHRPNARLGPIAILWGGLALFLFEPGNLRALAAVPLGLGWVLVGLDSLVSPVTDRSPEGVGRERRRRLRAAVPIGLSIALAGAALFGIGRLSGRESGVAGSARAAGEAIPIVIDTDSLPDDWIAITYLLARPDVDVRAITVSGSSLLGCGDGTLHVLGLLALAERPDVPVACGRLTSASPSHWFPIDWLAEHHRWRMAAPLPQPISGVSGDGAVEVLRAAIAESDRPVVLLALGPLTNVADLLAAHPAIRANITEIVVMGGAVDVGGNVGGDHEAAEWNFFVDPESADAVLRSGAPVTLVALDACGDVPVTPDVVERMRLAPLSAAQAYVVTLLSGQDEFVRSGDYYFWDPLAAVLAIDGRIAGFVERRLAVVTGTGSDSGRVVVADNGGLVRLAVSADAAAFERILIETLSGSVAARP